MLNVGELGLWQQEVSKGSCAVVLDLMNFGVREILHTHSVTMRGISDELVPLHGYIIPKEFNMHKECLNYKDIVVLVQNGRWFAIYVKGSLVSKNMSREEGVKKYFSYVREYEHSGS